MINNYTAVILKSGAWYAGFIKELPGAHSQGRTIEDVKENLKEAIRMVIDSNYRHYVQDYDQIIEEKISVEL